MEAEILVSLEKQRQCYLFIWLQVGIGILWEARSSKRQRHRDTERERHGERETDRDGRIVEGEKTRAGKARLAEQWVCYVCSQVCTQAGTHVMVNLIALIKVGDVCYSVRQHPTTHRLSSKHGT